MLPRALEIASEIAHNTSAVSFALMRDLMYRGPDSAEGTHLLDSRIIHELFGGKDNTEGVKSFKEKRAARFEGSVLRDAPGAWPWWERVDIGNRAIPQGKGPKSKL